MVLHRRSRQALEFAADWGCDVHLQQIRREGFRKRRAAMGLPPGDTDPYFDSMTDDEWKVLHHMLADHNCVLFCVTGKLYLATAEHNCFADIQVSAAQCCVTSN